MREWRRNDGQFRIKVNPLDFFWRSSRPIRGLDFELSTNRKPRFWQILAVSSIFIIILKSFNIIPPEWLWNDGMRIKWLCLKLSSQPKPVKIGASYWSRAQNRGLWLVERTLKKNLRGWPWFENVRHSTVIPSVWPHITVSPVIPGWEWQNGFGMTL